MKTPADKPPRHPPSLKAAPKVGQLYWCDFPKDAQLPELWKMRPILMLSHQNHLYGAVTIIPCSSKEQTDNKWAIRLSVSIESDRTSWAICDKPTTVAVSRLKPYRGGPKRLTREEFNIVLAKVLDWLPKIRPKNT